MSRVPIPPPSSRPRLTVVLAASLLTASLRPRLMAQDEGPVIVGVQQQWEGIKFEPLRFTLDFLGRVERNTITGPNGEKRKDNVDEVRGLLTAATGGFIGHPNLLEFRLAGSFGLDQQFIKSDSANRDEDPLQTLYEYDINILLLKQSTAPTTLYTRRNESFLQRQFSDSIRASVSETGIITILRSDLIPSTFQYYHRQEDQTSQINPTDFSLTQDTFEWDGQFRPDDSQTLNWEYAFNAIDTSGEQRQSNSLIRQTGLAVHSIDFGEEKQHNLNSSVFFFSETGNFPLNQVRLEERLRLRHTRQLESLYNYTFNWNENGNTDQFFNNLLAGVRHQTFDSLLTSANVGFNSIDIQPDSFQSYRGYGDLRLDYDKQVPLGLLTAFVFVGGQYQVDTDRGTPIDVNNEPRTFPPSDIITIERQNIEPFSIRVTNLADTITYIEGLDYVSRVFPDRAEIQRLIGGNIAPGETVLVDYRIGPEPGATITTFDYGAGARYQFEEWWLKGLGLYVNMFNQDQTITDNRSDGVLPPIGQPTRVPVDVQDLRFGVDYQIGYLTLSAERQMRDSTLSPFNVNRAQATYLQPFGRDTTIRFDASYNDIERPEEDSNTELIVVTGRWIQRVGRRLTFSVGAIWRNQNQSPGDNVQAFEQIAEIAWNYRQTTVYGSFTHSTVDTSGDDTDFLTVRVGLRREF